MRDFPPLPIDPALPELLAALEDGRNAVLAAPPGAGKTTRVPLALIGAGWAGVGRILMLEPRRIAARAAAERMAELLGEAVGGTVGYRIRGESKVSKATRIEVVTEGILTRMLQSDPELPGIAAVLFDEIHERSIHTDLGLALALEVQGALRPELRLLAMSATLDTGAVSRVMGQSEKGAPVIESAGWMFPVETRWLERAWARTAARLADRGQGRRDRGPRFEEAAAELVSKALSEAPGDALVFLPGAGEINRVAGILARLHPDLRLCPLYGALPFAKQRAALRVDAGGRRKVVLATAIAETSLTVEGIGIVVDCGRARRARMNPGTGMSRLVTVPVSRAEADQRRGRAGRLGPGVCYRMWSKGEEGALPDYAPPEILEADLAPLALELAQWGIGGGIDDPIGMAFLDAPPAPALTEARKLLVSLGALDGAGRITAHGRAMAARPTHPRLAHMMIRAGESGMAAEAVLVAALLGERDPLRGKGRPPADLALRLAALADPKRFKAEHAFTVERGAVERIRAEARRLNAGKAAPPGVAAQPGSAAQAGVLLSLAYPDRVGLRRSGDMPRYLLSGGRGAVLAADDPMASQRLIVAADLEDSGREATIRLAAALTEADLRALHGDNIGWRNSTEWSPRTRQVEARSREMFGAIALADRHWRDAPPEALGAALAEGIRALGLAALDWSKAAAGLRARVAWLHRGTGALVERLPDWSDVGLIANLDDWLTPHLGGMRRIGDVARLDLSTLLRTSLDWETLRHVDRAAPSHFETPLGDRVAIDYGGETPMLSVRVQELFGVTTHPTVGDPPVPLVVELLSPGRRPVQTTSDLPGFWASSYADVRKDMRARYPKHPWPEDPAKSEATRRAKPRR
jgi:ATP-dependent helicase HrpB